MKVQPQTIKTLGEETVEIVPIAVLQRSYRDLVDYVKHTQQPIYLSKRGKVEGVILCPVDVFEDLKKVKKLRERHGLKKMRKPRKDEKKEEKNILLRIAENSEDLDITSENYKDLLFESIANYEKPD